MPRDDGGAAAGAMLRLDPLAPRELTDGEAWVVRDGTVDLFRQPPAEDGRPGRRRHVLRAGPGGLLIGFASYLVAVGSRGAEVEVVRQDAVPGDPDLAAALEGWCDALNRGFGTDEAPQPGQATDATTLAALHAHAAARLDAATVGSGASGQEPATATRSEDACAVACRLAARACGTVLAIRTQPPVVGETVIDRVERTAGSAFLRVRRVRLAGRWWRGDRGVLVAELQNARQPAVLVPRPGGGYDMHEVHGPTARLTPERAAQLGVEALQCYPTLLGGAATPWRLLAVAVRGIGRDTWTFAATALATALLALAPPLAVAVLFDSIIPHAEADRVPAVAGGLAVLAVGIACFELAKAAALTRLEGRLALVTGGALTDRLLRLPVRFFAGHDAGDLAARLRGMEEIRRTLAGTTVVALVGSVLALPSLALLVWIDARLTLACAGVLAAGLAVALALNVAALRWERVAMEERGRVEALVVQIVIGIAKLRAAAAERRAMQTWTDRFAAMREALWRAEGARTRLQVLAAVLPLVTLATLFGGTVLLGAGASGGGAQARMPLGDFMVFSAALGTLLGAVLTLSAQLTSVLRVVPLYERALPLLHAVPEPSGAGAMGTAGLRGEIEFTGVSFRYDMDGPFVLHDVSLRIAAGELVAIVGPSGSGKSTLLRLLLGFEKPERGTVLLDGTPLGQYDIGAVRRAMGVVLQGSRLSPGNIFQNIVGHTGMDLEAAWEAARRAGLAADIEAMPMGMHTTMLENGQGLSGGQCQRLAIARALVARPRVVLFDEATSALDNRNQDVVSRSLAAVGGTRVVIAHRLSTIAGADRIIVLDRGRVVQSGRFDALLAAPGVFRDLAARQLL